MIVDKGKHYLYRHIRLDRDEVFYVGIGTKYGNRNFKTSTSEYYRALHKTHRGPIWKRISTKTNYEVEIILESDDYEFIKKKEIEFILLYGRIDLETGTLANLTNGGDGLLGGVHSAETKAKMSRSNDNSHFSKEQKDKFMKAGWEAVKKPILQYDLEGSFVKEWESIREAAHSLNIHEANISACTLGKYNHAGHFIWIDKVGEILPKIETSQRIRNLNNYHLRKDRLSKGIYLNKSRIEMINILDNTIKEYSSIKECELATGIKSFYICRLLASGKIYKKQYKFNYQKSIK
mgnify:CR=1 FL=1